MAKRTSKQNDPAGVTKGASTARTSKAAAGQQQATKTRASRPAKVPAFVPPTPEEIAVRAYFRAMERGFAPGDAMEDWLAAEAELIAWRRNAVPEPKAVRKAARGKKVERATGIEPV